MRVAGMKPWSLALTHLATRWSALNRSHSTAPIPYLGIEIKPRNYGLSTKYDDATSLQILKNNCFLFFSHTHGIQKFPGRGSNLSQNCDLCRHSSSNAGSFTHCTRPGIKPAPPQRQARPLTPCTTAGTPKIKFFNHLMKLAVALRQVS